MNVQSNDTSHAYKIATVSILVAILFVLMIASLTVMSTCRDISTNLVKIDKELQEIRNKEFKTPEVKIPEIKIPEVKIPEIPTVEVQPDKRTLTELINLKTELRSMNALNAQKAKFELAQYSLEHPHGRGLEAQADIVAARETMSLIQKNLRLLIDHIMNGM